MTFPFTYALYDTAMLRVGECNTLIITHSQRPRMRDL